MIFAQETLPTPAAEPAVPAAAKPAEAAPAATAQTVQASIPGLYEVTLPKEKITNLDEYKKTLIQKKYRILEAYEADGQAHLVLYVRSNAELGHLQYYLNQRLSPMSLPLQAGQTADANYTRLQQASQSPVIVQVKYDISAPTNTAVREGFDDFSTRAMNSGLSLYAITDVDGKSGQLKRYQNNRYALPFYSGNIYFRVNSLEDAYRLQSIRTSSVVTEIVMHEPQQRQQQQQQNQQTQAAGPNVPQSPYQQQQQGGVANGGYGGNGYGNNGYGNGGYGNNGYGNGFGNGNQDYQYPSQYGNRYRNQYPNYPQQQNR